MKKPKPEPERVRLSLECSLAFKEELMLHGEELGQWSLIGTIRESVRRSKELGELEREAAVE